jgi:hypothetical protein
MPVFFGALDGSEALLILRGYVGSFTQKQFHDLFGAVFNCLM